MERQEHLQWCKQRALKYLETGDIQNALTSMFSDLKKHKETENHPAIQLGFMGMISGLYKSVNDARKFIEDFN